MDNFPSQSAARTAAQDSGEWTALVLAGRRPEGDALAGHFGEKYKALIPLAGKPMLLHVIDALLGSDRIGRVIILAQEPGELLVGSGAGLADEPRIALAASGAGIARSIAAIAGTEMAPWPVLVTTADHPLLTSGMVDEFISGANGFDLAVGVSARSVVERQYPETRRTWLKFSDDHYSGTNLFALRGGESVPLLELWSSIEQDRKKSWKILTRFGPLLSLRALTRTITLEAAITAAGKRFGLRAGAVVMTNAEATMDVDKVADFEIAERIFENRPA